MNSETTRPHCLLRHGLHASGDSRVVGVCVVAARNVVAVATESDVVLASLSGDETARVAFHGSEKLGAMRGTSVSLIAATNDGRVVEWDVEAVRLRVRRKTAFPDVRGTNVAGLSVSHLGEVVAVAWENRAGVWVRVRQGPWRTVHAHAVPRMVCVSRTVVVSASDTETSITRLASAASAPVARPKWMLRRMEMAETGEYVGVTHDKFLYFSKTGMIRCFEYARHVAISADADLVAASFSDGQLQVQWRDDPCETIAVFTGAVRALDTKCDDANVWLAATDGFDVVVWRWDR